MTQTLLTVGLGEVVVLGIGVVFLGLVLLIGCVYLMNFLVEKLSKKEEAKPATTESAPTVNDEIPNREELVAAVCAAIAEEEGTDITAIRVVSIKKV
jgi:sodium pump decarboxylase gamma subunit